MRKSFFSFFVLSFSIFLVGCVSMSGEQGQNLSIVTDFNNPEEVSLYYKELFGTTKPTSTQINNYFQKEVMKVNFRSGSVITWKFMYPDVLLRYYQKGGLDMGITIDGTGFFAALITTSGKNQYDQSIRPLRPLTKSSKFTSTGTLQDLYLNGCANDVYVFSNKKYCKEVALHTGKLIYGLKFFPHSQVYAQGGSISPVILLVQLDKVIVFRPKFSTTPKYYLVEQKKGELEKHYDIQGQAYRQKGSEIIHEINAILQKEMQDGSTRLELIFSQIDTVAQKFE